MGADTRATASAIIEHLNDGILYYRASVQLIQKAGEPNDVVYRDQAIAHAAQIATFAFQSAKAEAIFLSGSLNVPDEEADQSHVTDQQRVTAAQTNIEKQITDLEEREEALDKQKETAKPRQLASILAERKQIRESLDLAHAMKDALHKIIGMSVASGGSRLETSIARLEGTIPELKSTNKIADPQFTDLDSMQSAGVTSQAAVVFQLIETRHALDQLIHDNRELQKEATDLRAPMLKVLRGLIKQSGILSPSANSAAPTASQPQAGSPSASAPFQNQPDLKNITVQFKAVSAATLPLTQEVIVIDQSRANLVAWQLSVTQEYNTILHALLLRILVIALALGLILGGSEIWKRATKKYIHDIRRRRQFFVVRRVVITFLSFIIIVFGFVTQFHSLTTFAGFITAGLVVGLQTILLSVAAYFFIIGRYGIKVGDRITIATVTGDIIEVGLVRFYMMELAGSGTALNPTGRIAVFSNAVLFQSGMPLYKQMPGTEYSWHELIVKLTDAANYKSVCDAVTKEVHTIYEEYRSRIEKQHEVVENWMQASIESPQVESRLQFTAGAFQLWVRFPVEIGHAAETDEKMTRALFDLIAANPEFKASIAAMPVIQPSVRG